MHQVHAHIHKRKRKAKNTRLIRFFDRLVVAMGALNLAATLPQVYAIWAGKNAAGVSELSWGYYSLFSLILFMYGIVHKEKPIVVTYTGSVVLYTVVFIGALIY